MILVVACMIWVLVCLLLLYLVLRFWMCYGEVLGCLLVWGVCVLLAILLWNIVRVDLPN